MCSKIQHEKAIHYPCDEYNMDHDDLETLDREFYLLRDILKSFLTISFHKNSDLLFDYALNLKLLYHPH